MLKDGPSFELSALISSLADAERTHFAARVGAGVTDLYMNALGYAWRDNAAGIASSFDPHGDFIYDGGRAAGHGVVLAEARGSFAASVSDAAIAGATERKYLRQVRPYIGATSPHGKIVHGYTVGFASRPGAPGAFLRLSQTHRPKAKSGPASPPTAAPSAAQPVSARIALATHRSNFILMDALPVANWIDWINGRSEVPDEAEPLLFGRFNYAGRSFLASAYKPGAHLTPYLWWDDHPFWYERWERHWERRRWPLDWFVIEESVGRAFLTALTVMIRQGPQRDFPAIELPTGGIAGFGSTGPDDRGEAPRGDYDFALFRDGLAMIAAPPPRKLLGVLSWHPKKGLLS